MLGLPRAHNVELLQRLPGYPVRPACCRNIHSALAAPKVPSIPRVPLGKKNSRPRQTLPPVLPKP